MKLKGLYRFSGLALGVVLIPSAHAGEWSEWRNASGSKFIQYRFRVDESKKDAFGSPTFLQFKNAGREVSDFRVEVSSAMLVSSDLGDSESEHDGHLRPNETSPEIALGMISKVNSVKVTRYAGQPDSSEPVKNDGPKKIEDILNTSVLSVLDAGKARQKKFEDLRARAVQDYAKMNQAFHELSLKDEKRKMEYAARVNRIEGLTMMMQQSQQNAFAANSFAPRNSMMYTTTPLSELSNQLRQLNPELAEFNAYADLAKTLTQFDADAFKQVDAIQGAANTVGALVNLFGGRKDPEEERREKLEKMRQSKENFEEIKANYDDAKAKAKPEHDALGNLILMADTEKFKSEFLKMSPENQKEAVDRLLSNGDCLMHIAAMTGSSELIRFLASNGASIECTDAEGRTPVYRAVEARETEAVVTLMGMGAVPTKLPMPKMADKPTLDALGLAKSQKNPTMVKALQKKIVPLSADPASLRICALARSGNASALKERLTSSSPNVRDELGWTPLHHAVASNRMNPDSPEQMETIQLLIDSGASLSAVNLTGRSPLTLAVEKDMPLAFMALIRAGADPKARDRAGNSAISLANDLHRDAILLLLEKEPKKK